MYEWLNVQYGMQCTWGGRVHAAERPARLHWVRLPRECLRWTLYTHNHPRGIFHLIEIDMDICIVIVTHRILGSPSWGHWCRPWRTSWQRSWDGSPYYQHCRGSRSELVEDDFHWKSSPPSRPATTATDAVGRHLKWSRIFLRKGCDLFPSHRSDHCDSTLRDDSYQEDFLYSNTCVFEEK